ncbi:GNAT family N-acetyltransferase [Ferrimonas pelagia]|uniref:N-acetyltransferase domain-containing protein n=1 Tax=Ferrimonas pelagia TaxID=1177826 RepID=A0ABP9EI42_9GAMM
MLIRTALTDDLPAMDKIFRQSAQGDQLALHKLPHYIAARGRSFVQIQADQIVGFIVLSQIEHSIVALYVLPQWQGRGIGTTLLEHGMHYLAQLGAKTITLRCHQHRSATAFYRQRGWSQGISQNRQHWQYRLADSVPYGARRSTSHPCAVR